MFLIEFEYRIKPLFDYDFDLVDIVPDSRIGIFARERLSDLKDFCKANPEFHIISRLMYANIEMNRVVEETKEKTKKEIISKPKSPSAVKTSDDSMSKFTEESIKGKSLWELAEEAKREAGI